MRWSIAVAVAVAAVAIGIGWSVGRMRDRSTSPAPTGDPALAELASLDLPAVNQRAIALVESHRFVESLPYFRREFELLEQPLWGLHHDFGTVLNNGAFQTRRVRGLTVPATRGTIERVALVREAIEENDRAARLAEVPPDRARVWERRAHVLWLWGFRWDGVSAYRSALDALPGSRAVGGRLQLRMAQMRDPVNVTAADEDVP